MRDGRQPMYGGCVERRMEGARVREGNHERCLSKLSHQFLYFVVSEVEPLKFSEAGEALQKVPNEVFSQFE